MGTWHQHQRPHRAARPTSGCGGTCPWWAIAAAVLLATSAAPQSGATDSAAPRLGLDTYVEGRDFLQRPTPSYRAYALEDYLLPETSFYARTNYYGPLGNYLLRGYGVYEWRELRANDVLGSTPTSNVWAAGPWNMFKRNIVARDGYGSWSTALMIGDEIRTVFTPLTLRWAGINGVRLDARRGPTSMTAFASRPTQVDGGGGSQRNYPMMVGGHLQRRVGQVTLGATFANFHQFDSRQSGFDLRGNLQAGQVLPTYVIVRFADDSPADETGGPRVLDVQLRINGEERPDLRPTFVRLNARNPTALGRTNRLTGQFQRTVYSDAGTKFADYLYLQRHLAGERVTNVNLEELVQFIQILPPEAGLQADGDWVIQAFFDLSTLSNVRQMEVQALVGNDYRIDVLGLYDSDPRQRSDESRWKIGGIEARARADGNVQDMSNLEWVELKVGAWTGRSIYGVDASWELGTARLRAEYVRSYDYRQYPDGPPGHREDKSVAAVRQWDGERTATQDEAYYVTAEWSGSRWAMGAEVYRLGPEFHRPLELPQRTNSSSVGAIPAPWDGFVEDNDDDDRFPDRGPGEARQGHFGDVNTDPDGVFPGNDANNDGIPDTNQNQNQIPDYDEPFLRYDVDPDAYVYGPDWNHNGVVDEREDDQEPDYPYRTDQRGAHAFGRVRVFPGLFVTIGRLVGEGVAGGGRNDSDYAQLSYRGESPRWGRLRVDNRVERVRDDIADDYRIYEETLSVVSAGAGGFVFRGTMGYTPVDVSDRLEWRNSVERQHYAEWEWRPLRGLHLLGNTRYAVNHQKGGELIEGRDLGEDNIRLLTAVWRAEYGWQPRPGWDVRAQVKVMRLHRDRDSQALPLQDAWTTIPIVKASYAITPLTRLWLGAQGLPGLPMRHRDGAIRLNSFDEEVRAIHITNQSPYLGYVILTSLGLRQEYRQYDDNTRLDDNRDVASIFLRVVLGYAD